MDSLIADVQEVLARLKLEHRSDLLLPDPESTSNQEQSDKDVSKSPLTFALKPISLMNCICFN